MRAALASFLFFVTIAASATPAYKGSLLTDPGDLRQVEAVMQETLDAMRNLNLKRAEDACRERIRGRSAASATNASCVQKYLKIYQNPIVDMRVVFGYKNSDSSGEVVDGAFRGAVVDEIIKPCPPASSGIFACGFKRAPDDAEVFFKEVINPRGEKRLVRLTVVQSAYKSSDAQNRNRRYEKAQERASAHAQQVFLDGLSHADVVLYNGHSRNGGGPEFKPAVLNSRGTTDFKWYQAHPVGIDAMLDALKKAKGHTPSVIGLISCLSEEHFYKVLKKAAPNSGYLLTHGLSWWPDEPATIIGSLNGLLGQICEPGFTSSVNANRKMDPTSRLVEKNLFGR